MARSEYQREVCSKRPRYLEGMEEDRFVICICVIWYIGTMPDITLNLFVPEREEETKKLQDGLDSLEFRFKC